MNSNSIAINAALAEKNGYGNNYSKAKNFTLAESDVLIGDSLEMIASWQGKTDLSTLVERPVRFRFVMKDANLFSLKIQ